MHVKSYIWLGSECEIVTSDQNNKFEWSFTDVEHIKAKFAVNVWRRHSSQVAFAFNSKFLLKWACTEPSSLNVFGQSIFFVFCVSAPGKEDNGCFICAKYGPAMHRCHFRTSLPEWSKWSKPVMLRISLQFDTGHFVHFVRQDCPRTVSWSRQRFLMLRTRRRSDIQAFSSTSWREGCTNYISDTGGAVGMVCVKLHL